MGSRIDDSVTTLDEAQGSQRGTQTANRDVDVIGIPHVTEPQFIDFVGPKRLDISQIEELRPAGILGIEARQVGLRVGIVQGILVHEVIAGDHSQFCAGVNLDAALIVLKRLRIRRGRKVVTVIGKGNVLHEGAGG